MSRSTGPSGGGPDVFEIDECRLAVVRDELSECPYLDPQVARMPLHLPFDRLDPRATDELFARGFRRSGFFLYYTRCPMCAACQPTRLEIERFSIRGSLRRVLNRGDRDLTCRWGAPAADAARVSMFNRHRRTRGLDRDDNDIDRLGYRSFVVDTCCETRELAIEHRGRLVAVAIVDVGAVSMSAVYTHFEPDAGRWSLGTYAILKQVERARQERRRFLYLGMNVAENPHLNYKARFVPQQRLLRGEWIPFERDTRPPER